MGEGSFYSIARQRAHRQTLTQQPSPASRTNAPPAPIATTTGTGRPVEVELLGASVGTGVGASVGTGVVSLDELLGANVVWLITG